MLYHRSHKVSYYSDFTLNVIHPSKGGHIFDGSVSVCPYIVYIRDLNFLLSAHNLRSAQANITKLHKHLHH